MVSCQRLIVILFFVGLIALGSEGIESCVNRILSTCAKQLPIVAHLQIHKQTHQKHERNGQIKRVKEKRENKYVHIYEMNFDCDGLLCC